MSKMKNNQQIGWRKHSQNIMKKVKKKYKIQTTVYVQY